MKTAKKKATKKVAKKVSKKKAVKKVVKKVAKKKATVSKDKKQEVILVQNPANPTESMIVAQELADDASIEQELSGELVSTFIYQFAQDGKPVTGLSVAGVNEAVRRLAKNRASGIKIRVEPSSLVISRDVTYNGKLGVEVSVYANNLVSGEGAFGIKFEPYMKTGRNGNYENTFAVEKALSKAERNAKRKLIPEKAVISMIQTLMKENPSSVKNLEAPKNALPPAKNAQPDSPIDFRNQLKWQLFNLGGKNPEMSESEAMEILFSKTGMQFQSLIKMTQNECKLALAKLLHK